MSAFVMPAATARHPKRRGAAKACAFGALGVAAATLVFNSKSLDAFFAAGSNHIGQPGPTRFAGHFVEVDELPRGAVCRAAYGDQSERPEWDPLPQWRGEKSYHPTRELQADENRQWYHFDAEGKSLGHLAQAIALTMRGKDSPLYDPIRDVGAFVVVTNCEKVRVSGRKYHYKLYFRNLSFQPGHMQVERFRQLQKRFPERIIMRSVWGSMPKTPSCRRIFKDRLKLFVGPNHLYYHKDPVEYPMHTVKDVTHTQNLRPQERIEHFFTRLYPRKVKRAAASGKVLAVQRLDKYKEFVKAQYEDMGEKATDVSLDDIKVQAQEDRYSKVYTDAGGANAKVVKPETRVWPGSNIPRKKVSSNKPSQR